MLFETVRHPFERIASAYRDKFSRESVNSLEDESGIENK
jgi:Sulfotransferase family